MKLSHNCLDISLNKRGLTVSEKKEAEKSMSLKTSKKMLQDKLAHKLTDIYSMSMNYTCLFCTILFTDSYDFNFNF